MSPTGEGSSITLPREGSHGWGGDAGWWEHAERWWEQGAGPGLGLLSGKAGCPGYAEPV